MSADVPDMLSLELLSALDVLASSASFSAVAQQFGLSQQAVSQRMGALERTVGCTLFSRSPRGVALTAVGHRLAEQGREVIEAGDRFRSLAVEIAAQRDAELTIAASLTVAEHLLPLWLLAFRRDAGVDAVQTHLSTVNSTQVCQAVLDGGAELGFIESSEFPRELNSRVVAHDELVVVVSPRHSWAAERRASLAELLAAPILLRETGSGTREVFESALRDVTGQAPLIAAEFPSTSAVVTAAINADLPAVVSRLAVRDELATGRVRLIEVDALMLQRDLRAVWRGQLSRAAERFLASLPAA
ncbi:LysR family transcriptional regulator [Psychromicrobium xiongbiense]|uniref:LysR family transcriptional regulator n=1 Tax=Psychromicrobium xiongbiense TaxID=3051184 RepID=UPI0025569C5F|nr:LysR family transcriptional regulator [Psychromicrobium sp. YIM S02556]